MNINHEKKISSKSAWSLIFEIIRAKIFTYLTRRALPVFVRGGDIISIGPLLNGSHEPQVASAIKYFSETGYSDFFVDVGANIGLTSMQCGNWFKSVHAFEPSPLCHGVLKTNLAITLVDTPFSVMEFGLGRNNESMALRVPRHNWGGAHVVCEDNSYSADVLLLKDGFKSYDQNNYLTLDIEIKAAEEIFTKLFANLIAEGKQSGVIKIDVEGLETIIIESIAKTVPNNFKLYIIFEYLNSKELVADVLEPFKNRAELYCLAKSPQTKGSSLVKLFSLIASGKQSYVLKKWHQGLSATDFILHVNYDK